MQFLRTIFWVVLAVLAMIFAFNNWVLVTIRLWSGLVLDTQLPVLLLVVFLIGLLPPWILHKATRWSMKRRLDAAQRTIDETRAVIVEPAVVPPLQVTP